MRSDRGEENYSQYNKMGLNPDSFAIFLHSHGICAKHKLSGSPHKNSVSKRHKRTLKEIVLNMLTNPTS